VVIAFDIGNSSIECGIFKDMSLVDRWRLNAEILEDTNRLDSMLADSLRNRQIGTPKGVVAASVVSGATEALGGAVRHLWDGPFVIADVDKGLGLEVCVPNPRGVGIDRLLAAAEAYRITGGPVVVVDLGTALTVDVVFGGGCYQGGTISAGLRQIAKALSTGTSLLPEVDLVRPDFIVGKSTSECIRAGIVFGAAGTVDRLVSELVDAAGGSAEVLVTGGDAHFISPFLSVSHRVEEGLVLKGLIRLYHRCVDTK
jgi:type III pantothenate kinase